jgi:histidine triad (HIT) family protein
VHTHAPEGYLCPFCLIVQGIEQDDVYTRSADIVYRTEAVTAFIGSHQWPNNRGHVILIPNAHYENLYDLPLTVATQIHAAVRTVALAMKRAYGCPGISTRQHNEPAGNQEIWHYHVHVFPRWPDDALYGSRRSFMPPEERLLYAERLRSCLKDHEETD